MLGDGEFACGPCAVDNQTYVAIGYCQFCHHFLCKSCFSYHQNLGKAHVLLDKDNMPQTVVSPVPNFDPLLETCREHKHKTLELYCKGHDEVCCVICVTSRHKNCDYVYIPDYTVTLPQPPADDCSSVLKLTQDLIGQLDTMKSESSKQIKDLDKQKREFILSVRKYRKEIDIVLDQLEKQVINGMKQVVDINTHDLQKNIKKCENALKTLQESYKRTASALDCGSVNRLFTLSKTSNKHLQENNAVLKAVRDSSIDVTIKFDENAEILRQVRKNKMFGKVSVKKEAVRFNIGNQNAEEKKGAKENIKEEEEPQK